MESPCFSILVLLFLALAVSKATLLPQVYWNSMLPNTPMPKAIKDILRPNLKGYKGLDENGDGKQKLGNRGSQTNVAVSYDAGKKSDGKSKFSNHGSNANVSISYDADKKGDGKSKFSNHGSNANNVTVSYDGGRQFHGEPKATVFFLLKDMVAGTQMNLGFPTMENDASLVPRYIADSIPFSSNEFPEILNKLSIKPESTDAKIMETTIKTCEQPGIKGENKICATSLESMIDFTTSNLGKQVQAVSSEVQQVNQIKKYKVMKGIKKLVDDESVVCHELNYPYAVFYCHAIPSTSVYMVPLEATDGSSRAKAIAVCHKDTSAWNPNHVAFEMVKVKPGTLPICHFPEDSVIWSRK